MEVLRIAYERESGRVPTYVGGLPSEGMIRAALKEARGSEVMDERRSAPVSKTEPDRGSGAHTSFVSLAAIGSVLAAMSCCLPVFPFMMAAGLAGGSAFLTAARPYFLVASVLLIAWGFYQTRHTGRCRRRPKLISLILLWISAGFVMVSVLFPQMMANVAAGLLAR
jgi:hypothetical protein